MYHKAIERESMARPLARVAAHSCSQVAEECGNPSGLPRTYLDARDFLIRDFASKYLLDFTADIQAAELRDMLDALELAPACRDPAAEKPERRALRRLWKFMGGRSLSYNRFKEILEQ